MSNVASVRKDVLVPFVFEHLPVRGAIVQLADEWRALREGHDYSPELTEVLGHAAAATPLIAQSMKSGSSVTLQLTGKAPLSMLVMQSTNDLEFRGLASATQSTEGLSFAQLTAGARCAITVSNVNAERPYQGIVEVGGSALANCLENYFLRSAQVPSYLSLIANDDVCAGLLLQQMPGEREPHGDDWRRLGFLAETLRSEDVIDGVGTGLLGKLFSEDDVRVFDPRAAVFRCRCSRLRAANALKLLGEEECELTDDDEDHIVVTCEYCGNRESFDPVDIAAIFAAGPQVSSPSVH
ncbi:MAG: Hsp33 family molecular chaperone HslO [Pseudomonadota bacterium]